MLQVPYDRFLDPTDPMMLQIPVPIMEQDPTIANYVAQAAKTIASWIYRSASSNSQAYMYLYNLVSVNGWNNQDWQALLSVAANYFRYYGYGVDVARAASTTYLGMLLKQTPQLRSLMDRNLLSEVAQSDSTYNGILRQASVMAPQNVTNNHWPTRQPMNSGMNMMQGSPQMGRRPMNQNPRGGAGWVNNPAQQEETFTNRFDKKNPGAQMSMQRPPTKPPVEEKKEEVIQEPKPTLRSLYTPLTFGPWYAKKIVNNNTYTWELTMKEEDHVLKYTPSDAIDMDELDMELAQAYSNAEVNELNEHTIVDDNIREAMITVRLASHKAFSAGSTTAIFRAITVRNMLASAAFRYTDGRLLNNVVVNDDNAVYSDRQFFGALLDLMTDYNNDKDVMAILKYLDSYITEKINAYMKKHIVTDVYIDSYVEDYMDLLSVVTNSESKKVSEETNRILKSIGLSTPNDETMRETKDCGFIKTSDSDRFGVCTMTESYTIHAVKYTAADLQIDGLDPDTVYKVVEAIDKKFYSIIEKTVMLRDKLANNALCGYLLCSDGSLFEISKDHEYDDLLISVASV